MDRTDYLKTIPETMQATFKKAFSGKGLRAAIKAKCLDCSCFSRNEVAQCTVVNCPLFECSRPKINSAVSNAVELTCQKNQDADNVKSIVKTAGLVKWRLNKEQSRLNKKD